MHYPHANCFPVPVTIHLLPVGEYQGCYHVTMLPANHANPIEKGNGDRLSALFLKASGRKALLRISIIDNRRTVSVGQKRGVVKNFCWGGVCIKSLESTILYWLFFNSLFLSPCNVFFVLLFRRFFPLFRFRGRPLATYYLYLRYFNILLWMGRGIGRFCLWVELVRLYDIWIIFTFQYI